MNFPPNATLSRGFTFLARRRRSSSHVAKSADTVVRRTHPSKITKGGCSLFRGDSADSLKTKEARCPRPPWRLCDVVTCEQAQAHWAAGSVCRGCIQAL